MSVCPVVAVMASSAAAASVTVVNAWSGMEGQALQHYPGNPSFHIYIYIYMQKIDW